MPLNPEFLSRFAAKAKGSFFFGEPIESLSREELIAMVGFLIHEAESKDKSHENQVKLERSFTKFYKRACS